MSSMHQRYYENNKFSYQIIKKSRVYKYILLPPRGSFVIVIFWVILG